MKKLTKKIAEEITKEKDNHTLGITGIWGIANGSINVIIDNNFIFFNFVP